MVEKVWVLGGRRREGEGGGKQPAKGRDNVQPQPCTHPEDLEAVVGRVTSLAATQLPSRIMSRMYAW
jgi:hypothetical protein